MTRLEPAVRAHLARLVDDVHPDPEWQWRLLASLAEEHRRRRVPVLAKLLAVAAVVSVLGVVWGSSRPPGAEVADQASLAQLPAWAQEQILATGSPVPPSTSLTKLGTVTYDGQRAYLHPVAGTGPVEIIGLGHDLTTRPQWTAQSSLVLLRPRGGCPVVADLHAFGAIEQVMRRCDAIALSPDGTTLLLGEASSEGVPSLISGVLDLDTGDEHTLAEPVELE